MNKDKKIEQIKKDLMRIVTKGGTLTGLSMKTGEYSLLPEVEKILEHHLIKSREEGRKEAVKDIKGMKLKWNNKFYMYDTDRDLQEEELVGYNRAIDEIIKLLIHKRKDKE